MSKIKDYINSGILEAYVLGLTSAQEQNDVEKMAVEYIEVRIAMDEFSKNFQHYAQANASFKPHPTVKPMLLATINYVERMAWGEAPTYPPLLQEGSKILDYTEWLKRSDFVLPTHFTDLHLRIIEFTPQATTAIVWIKEMAPQEIHTDEVEKFLIVEGTCTITIGDEDHYLNPGDYLAIPLYKNHHVKVTSDTPCKAILQRIAA